MKYCFIFILCLFFIIACAPYEPVIYRPDLSKNMEPQELIFSWMPFKGAESYQLEISEDSAFPPGKTQAFQPEKSAWKGRAVFSDNTKLYFRLRARLATEEFTPWSTVFTFLYGSPEDTPSAQNSSRLREPDITLLNPDNDQFIGPGELPLVWSESRQYFSYRIEISGDSTFPENSTLSFDSDKAYLTLPKGQLKSGTYFWRARGMAAGIKDTAAPWSSTARFNLVDNLKEAYLNVWQIPAVENSTGVSVSGELRQGQTITLSFQGPPAKEEKETFLDYRLEVAFYKDDLFYKVPGYFAADGNAADTSAAEGNVWRCHFVPDSPGTWRWAVSFRKGEGVAVSLAPQAGKPDTTLDGKNGSLNIRLPVARAEGFLAKGMLRYRGESFLRFDDGTYFLKSGINSPENFLAYHEFDGGGRHKYSRYTEYSGSSDSSWAGGKGKAITGFLNWLSGKGVNAVYMLLLNNHGDGKDVWPWTGPDEYLAYDVSKLDQWDRVFTHMDQKGVMLHLVLSEMEIKSYFEAKEGTPGIAAVSRKLFYRELAARFSHHRAITWNLGEGLLVSGTGYEQDLTAPQIAAFSSYLKSLDPYNHPVVLHSSFSDITGDILRKPLMGYPHFDGYSIHITNKFDFEFSQIVNLKIKSLEAGHPLIFSLDEFTYSLQLEDREFFLRLRRLLWRNFIHGMAGMEWFAAGEDISLEDWHRRQLLLDYSKLCLDFFKQYTPFHELELFENISTEKMNLCPGIPGQLLILYLPQGNSVPLNLARFPGSYDVFWYDPGIGGDLKQSFIKQIEGGSISETGIAPGDTNQDWVVLLKRAG